MSNSMRSHFSGFGSYGQSQSFADPWADMASAAMPGTHRNALYWAEYIYSLFGTYSMAMERVISYFITNVAVSDASDDEKEKWEDFLKETINVRHLLQGMLRNRMCFHGDTLTTTRNGVFKLRDLAGKTVDVLSEGGVYRSATFKSFGTQELLEVEFSDGRKVLATADHQWIVTKSTGGTVRVPTTALTGRSIPRTVAPRPEQNEDFFEGVRHGFVFGDGSLTNDGQQSTAYFFGDKDAAMVKYFAGHGCEPHKQPNRDVTVIHGLSPAYKFLPANKESASYWYGFVCGFLAADGSVDTYGCAVLTQKSKATLRAIEKQLPRIGMTAGPLRGHNRKAEFKRKSGKVDKYEGKMHYMTLLKQFMQSQDFLLEKHRSNFDENNKSTKYGENIRVSDVRETGIIDEVFCCEEMETHSFVVGNGVLTGNCYGNAFASLTIPFVRLLGCPKCKSWWKLSEVYNNNVFNFTFSEQLDFHATCPVCKTGSGYRGKFKVDDKDDDSEKKINVKMWSPHDIELVHDPLTDDVQYIWRIPEDYKQLVRKGSLFHLERVTKEVLKAIKHNHVYKFHDDQLFHMKEPTLAGVMNRGWGIPRIIPNFRQIWYVQVLRRFNEAIALDYVMPFRIITPSPRSGSSAGGGMNIDPMLMLNGEDYRGQLRRLLANHRRDPAGYQIMPFPVEYQMLGAEANQLAPRDLLDQGMETLLNDVGTPIELYKGTLQLQTAPVALRLFESTWQHLVHDCNRFLGWMVKQLCQILSWETVKAKLEPVTLADDMQQQMNALQLFMSQQLSGTTAFRYLGQNWKQEQKQIAEEARIQAEIQARNQEEMEQAGFAQQIAKGMPPGGGGAPPGGGGAPPGGGGAPPPGTAQQSTAGAMQSGVSMGGPVSDYLQTLSPQVAQTPEDMLAVADQVANQLLGMPEGQKDSELRKLKQANETLHSLVKGKMEQIRRDAKSQAGNQAMGQMQQGGGQPPM